MREYCQILRGMVAEKRSDDEIATEVKRMTEEVNNIQIAIIKSSLILAYLSQQDYCIDVHQQTSLLKSL